MIQFDLKNSFLKKILLLKIPKISVDAKIEVVGTLRLVDVVCIWGGIKNGGCCTVFEISEEVGKFLTNAKNLKQKKF